MRFDENYTKEEEALCVELCDTVNKDKELAVFFKERAGSILQTFAHDIITAWTKKDKQEAKEATQEAGEMIKALVMHIHVKVMVKEKDSPSLN